MNFRKCPFSFLTAVALLLLTASFNPVFAQAAPILGTAQSFAILGASAVTNTGPTIINGDLGLSPGTAVTGFPPGIVNGTIHAADAVAAQARNDANTAYNSLAGQPCNTILTGQDLGGLTLTSGVYCFASSAQLTGTLTLNGQGNPNAVFIFKMGSTLTTASNSSVVLVNGSTACNVFFQVGSSATLGTGTQFIGNIFALASVTLTTNVTVSGRAVGLNGAVTLDSTVVSVPTCSGVPATGFVQVCKVAGPGVGVGTEFTFNVAGTPVTVQAGAAPGGSCSIPVTAPTGAAVITETLPSGIALTGVSTLPSAGLLIGSNLAAGTATVTVTVGGQTIVTFTNAAGSVPGNGFVQVCKVAGSGVSLGTLFEFSVAGAPLSVAAGPPPGGTCSAPLAEPAGTVRITETLPPGVALTAVSTAPPAAPVSSNLDAGTATVTVTTGATTIVTLTDAVIVVQGAFWIRYASNLTNGDSVINITNTGVNGASLNGPGFGAPAGNLCVNVYTFSPDEQLVSCCSCLVTPNGLVHVTANNDLVSNTLTGLRPDSIVVKLVSTGAGKNFQGDSCANSAALAGTAAFPLANGMLAWGTTLHSASSIDPNPAGPFSITETPFLPATLSTEELASITNRCTNIVGNGSTFGQCRSCRLGGLGASRQ